MTDQEISKLTAAVLNVLDIHHTSLPLMIGLRAVIKSHVLDERTDHQKLVDVFNEVGVKFELNPYRDLPSIPAEQNILQLNSDLSKYGYIGMMCDFTFDPDGKFDHYACVE